MSGIFLAIIVCVIAAALFSIGYMAWHHDASNAGTGTHNHTDPDIHNKPHGHSNPDTHNKPHSHTDPGHITNHDDGT